jgi:glutamate dehydrogenase (NAD(P)+)
VSDTKGGILNRRGFNIKNLLAHKEKTGTVAKFPGSTPISSEEVLELECDILVPAALENQITLRNAARVKAKIIAEAANGPTTPGADKILHKNNIMVIPDILANAGGVTVSYFEWVQDLQELFWDEAEVNKRLERIMMRAFEAVYANVKKYKVDMRTAAYILAIDRVVKATQSRGIWP